MELRIREVDKGSAARVTNTREAGPNLRRTLHGLVPALSFVELAIISVGTEWIGSILAIASDGTGFVIVKRAVKQDKNWNSAYAKLTKAMRRKL